MLFCLALFVLFYVVSLDCSFGAEKAVAETRFAARVAQRFLDPSPRPSLNKRLRDTYWDAVRQVGALPLEGAKAALIRGGAKLDWEFKPDRPEYTPAFAEFIVCTSPEGPPGAIPSYIRLEITDMGPSRPVKVACELAIDLEGKNISYDRLRRATGFRDNFVANLVLFSQDCRAALEGQAITGLKISYGRCVVMGLPYTGFGFTVEIHKEPANETILYYSAVSGYDPVYIGSRVVTKANGMAVRDDVFLEVEERIKDAIGGKSFWK